MAHGIANWIAQNAPDRGKSAQVKEGLPSAERGELVRLDGAESDQIDPSTAVKEVRRPRAFNATRQAGFSKLDDVGKAHFEVNRDHAEASP